MARAITCRICQVRAVNIATSDDLPVAKPRISGRRILLAMLGVIAIAIAVLVYAYVSREKDPKLQDLGTVPAFSLTDEYGQTFTEDGLRGHPTIVSFVFTRCDSICPTIAGQVAKMQEHTADPQGAAIKLVTISVDPEYDTPERLLAYAHRFHADSSRWKFLTGPKQAIESLVTGVFFINMDRTGTSKGGVPKIAHQGVFLLVDGNLKIRGIYHSENIQELDNLEHHARFLARTEDVPYKFGS